MNCRRDTGMSFDAPCGWRTNKTYSVTHLAVTEASQEGLSFHIFWRTLSFNAGTDAPAMTLFMLDTWVNADNGLAQTVADQALELNGQPMQTSVRNGRST